MKRLTEFVRYGVKTPSTKSSVLLLLTTFLITLQLVSCSTIYEESDSLAEVAQHNDRNDLTFCQQLRNFESRRSRDYKEKGSKVQVRIPRCTRLGEFEPVQCSNELDNTHCFCVDEYGIEIPGTRADSEERVTCSAPKNDCPAASCRMFCSSGFARNETTGCTICKCYDPCFNVQCPNGHECEPIEIKCKDEPCPPIPTCRKSRSIKEFCPAGSPLTITGTIRPFLCGNDPGKPQCPPLFKCVVQSGNDYGVCCPASLKYEKPGTCPKPSDTISSPDHGLLCGSSCSHDLECPHMQKCCENSACGKTCQNTRDVTLCHQAKLQSEILAITDREGRGYVPQCDKNTGKFDAKQCSNNGLVCWCVNPENGNKIKGTIGAAKSVRCDNVENLLIRSGARSMDGDNQCDQNICAAVCQYGFKTDHNGCNTCECEEPCEGFVCPLGSKCIVARDPKCTLPGSRLCLSEPVCQPDLLYSNPCENGVPLTHNFTEEIAYCQEDLNQAEHQIQSFYDASDENVEGRAMMMKITCPDGFKCTRLKAQSESVCCPTDLVAAANQEESEVITDRQQTMCEYLRDFSERMEGTEEGMALAIKPPKCNADGSFVSMQCQLRRMSVTKAEQKKVLEQNNIREMRKLLSNRRKRDIETLKLIRVDNKQRRSDESESDDLSAQDVIEFLKRKIFQSPERFLSELFGDQVQSRTAKVIDIVAEDYDDEEMESRDERKLPIKASNKKNDLVEVEVEECFCVDRYGTEIPKTRGSMNVTEDECNNVRDKLECLDLTCRMGCDYGFVIDSETQCPTCQCRDPCDSVQCEDSQECRTVEVSCEDSYCPPVPSCFPKKPGMCPYLVPPAGENSEDTCAFECRSDNHCGNSKKCCSNGCGTVCVEPMLKSACQHLQSIQIHQAIELGIPAKQKYIAQCNEDGSWQTIQCGPNNVCWCVDDRGNEKSGTRVSNEVPNCSVNKSSNCPQLKCRSCEHGYVFDSNGCKTCECKDLCKEIKCPLDEQCELVQVECVDSQPCPRMPICTPIRDSVCTEGLPLKLNGREINCGPDAAECPTTHTCNLNPITKHGVCCAKSRDVCFESIDSSCILNDNDVSESTIKYRFNPRYNKCTPMRLSKTKTSTCSSKNLFHSEQACKSVCPVLTQCERLRLKNSIAARRRADKTDIWFRPRCDSETGHWSSVQCLGGENANDQTRVCWCADKKGSPMKGSLTKGVVEPICNYRQARRRVAEPSDPVMEQLISQITFLTDESNFLDEDDESLESPSDKIIAATEKALELSEQYGESSKKLIASTTRCDALRETARFTVTCDEHGNFSPTQCNHETCWCVDEAGNQLPFSNTFRKGSKSCKFTPLDAIEIELNLINPNNVKLRNLYDVMFEDVKQLIGEESFVNFRVQENSDGSVTLKFDLVDESKVNQAFAIEEMSKEDNLYLFHGMLKVDIRQSKFSHKFPMELFTNAQKSSLGIPQNTFHTIVFIMATSSAFIISILVIYVMLKKGRTKDKTHYVNNKNLHSGDKYVDYTSPIFVLSANDLPRSHHNDDS